MHCDYTFAGLEHTIAPTFESVRLTQFANTNTLENVRNTCRLIGKAMQEEVMLKEQLNTSCIGMYLECE